MNSAGKMMEQCEGVKVYECFADGTFTKAKGGAGALDHPKDAFGTDPLEHPHHGSSH